MPDSSGDPLPLPDKQPGLPLQIDTTVSPVPLAPAPRIHPPGAHHSRNAHKPLPVALPPGLAQVLDWMKQNGHIEAQAAGLSETALPEEAMRRAQLSKEQRKFHKFDPDHPAPRITGREKALLEDRFRDSQEEEDIMGVAQLRGIDSNQIARLRRIRRDEQDPVLWTSVGVGVLVFLLVGVAFLLNHTTLAQLFSAKRAPTEIVAIGNAVPIEIPAEVSALIDESTVAEAAKDYTGAIDRLERVQRDGKHVYGLNYHLAALYLKANSGARALPLLNRSIIEGEQMAASCNLRGLLTNQSSGPDQGLPDLEKATQIDPFNARYFFDWGEALRQAGNPRSALDQLKRALDRLQDLSLVPWYSLKIHLTELELGQEDVFVNELDARLKQASAPADLLLTAAAVEMRRGDFLAAAEYLNQVSALLGEHETMKQLQDIYFASFAHEKALAKFYEGATLPVNVTLP